MTRRNPLRRVSSEGSSRSAPAHALVDAHRVVWFSTPPPLLYGPAGARLAPAEIMALLAAMGQREAVFDGSKPSGRVPLALEAITPALVLQPWFGKLAPYLLTSDVAVLWRIDGGQDMDSTHRKRHSLHLGGLRRELGKLRHEPPKEKARPVPKALTGHIAALTAFVLVASVHHSPEAMTKLVHFDPELVAADIRRTGLGVFFGEDVEWLCPPTVTIPPVRLGGDVPCAVH
ncbi:hypothetical protein Q8F55_003117 [Vanrija albida]|uniref:Uncharacterized protein n=1 Tax=Vanrija albida TaxID=181172 RepID=A0ABR3QC95_9TREE